MSDDEAAPTVECPRCGSQQITAQKAGFGVGKALVGAALTGGIGLLAGGIGRNKITITCLACGQTWKPGEEDQVRPLESGELLRQVKWGLAILGVVGFLCFLFWLVS